MGKFLLRVVYSIIAILYSIVGFAQITANFSANTISGCTPILVQFTDNSTGNPVSWNWNLGNGTISTLQNPSTTYLNSGSYTVTLTVTDANGVTNTKTITNYITAVPTPTVNFVASDTIAQCTPKTIQFTDLTNVGSSGAATYFWDFGDGFTSTAQNPTHTYSTPGNYSVTLSVTNSSNCTKIFTKSNYIHIVNKPVVNFNASLTGSCTVPLTVNFTNTTTGATTYSWNFGNSATSVATNPSATYTAPGSYTVTLIGSNGGCSDTNVKTAFINIGNLTASFTQSATSTCTGNSVSFTNTSQPGPGTSTWYFGDGASVVSTNATHAYSSPGTYTVTLIVNYNNCSDTATSTVTVNQGPTPQFTANSQMSCSVPFTVNFMNASTGAVSYVWDFGDGSPTSSTTNPTHTYTSFGNYTVTLTATAANGCSNTIVMSNYISVYQGNMTITANPPSGCAPATIAFSTSLTPNVTVTNYTWNFGDGSPTVVGGSTASHTYSSQGTYTVSVTYTVGQGCTFTSSPITVNIGLPPTANFTGTPTTICPQGTVTFTNTSTGPTGTTYTWYFGDGSQVTTSNTTVTHGYNAQGTYTVTLVASSGGCNDTLVINNMVVVNYPKADFSPTYSCTNKLQVVFTDLSIGSTSTSLTWSWDFGDGSPVVTTQSPTHTYAASGNYSVTLTVTDAVTGCTSYKTKTVSLWDVTPAFVANDTVVCRNQSVVFTAQLSTTDASHVVSYDWYYGDGTFTLNSSSSASHTYTANGVYTVMLVTKDSRNCLDTLIKNNYISVFGPTANFSGTPLSGCVPLLVNFTDQSTTGGNPIANYTWRFGDGISNTLNQQNPSHTYTANGTYSVTLVLTNTMGCMDSLVRSNYINAIKPHAAFTADTFACPNVSVPFTNTSSGNNLTYVWNFGDGSPTTTVTSPSHSFSAGDYTVTLYVTDNGSCKDTATLNIHVTGINLSFTASDTFSNCPPLTVTFNNTSTGTGSILWTFGNGNSSSTSTPTTIYTLPGVYTVKLKAQNGNGCQDSITKTITVLGPIGTLSFSPLNGCLPLTVTYTSASQNTQTYIWDMDNGYTQTTTSNTFSYTYTQPGIYIPRVILTDGSSCQVPIQGMDTVIVDRIIGDFSYTPNNVCQNGTIQFTDTVLSSFNPLATRSWTFGDGGTSTAHNPTHYYSAPGTYTVNLIVATTQGCGDTITKTVTILQSPTVTTGTNPSLCQGQTLSAQLQASGASTYVWSPAGGLSCSSCSNPVASPSVTTAYTVIGTAANGCKDTANVTVVVNPLPNVTAGPPLSICNGSSVQLTSSGAVSYVWSPNTNLTCTNCQSPTASPTATTTYIVTGTDANGCYDTGQVVVTVNNNPVVSAGSSTAICVGASTILQATGATNYSWSPTTGLSCTNCASPTATPTVTTTYIVTGTNAANCADTGVVTITVNPLPVITVSGNQSLCLGISTQLTASGAASYNWSPTTGLSCNNCNNPTVNISATTTYIIKGTNTAGCIDSVQATVVINTPPTVTVTANNTTICQGVSTPLQASGAVSYSWSPTTGLSCSNCANPTASPTATTTYTVIGTDANGCMDTAQVTITVNPKPTVTTSPDVSICPFTTTQLQASGTANYSWSPTTGLSCTNCVSPFASPSSTTTYTVTGTDANGCSNTANVTVTVFPQPNVNAGNDVTICKGQSTSLQASGAINYTWSPIATLSCSNCNAPVAKPSTTTTYTVIGTDANGCNDTDQVTVTVIQPQPITISKNDTICSGESISLSITGGDGYTWLPPTGLDNYTSSTVISTPTQTTTYSVIVTQGSCFTDTAYVTVFVNPTPTVDAGPDQDILAGSSVMLYANTTFTTKYLWSPSNTLSCSNCQNPTATPDQSTTYTVEVSNQYGCIAKDDVTINIRCDNSLLYMANTFTPNGDGNNDRFYPQGSGITIVKSFRIYSRWGELMYEAKNIQANDESMGWDGTFKGQPLKPDVYVYTVEAVCLTGYTLQQKGDISIVK